MLSSVDKISERFAHPLRPKSSNRLINMEKPDQARREGCPQRLGLLYRHGTLGCSSLILIYPKNPAVANE
jgi:hypothetical protein